MAVIDTETIQTPIEELHRFALAQSYFELTQLTSWKDLQERLQGLVDQAQQELFSSRAVDVNQIIEEKLRWQQRLLMQQAIRSIVESQLKLRDDILEELKSEDLNEHDSTSS